ncbi:MAG TPA: hypothetical protein VMU07_00355 [Candidatus Paceibacterota bacterium]|nr:hypothetical protein [Candidatus Paceibacterota bacterium]
MAGYPIKQKILSWLRVQSIGGGLEITDQVIRLALVDGMTIHTLSVRLDPGILKNGTVADPGGFRTALRALRKSVSEIKHSSRRLSVSVVLSAVNVYSQVFSLPIIEGSDFEKAVALNVQMLSPMDINQVYSGWERLGRDDKTLRIEMLAAFVDCKTVDGIAAALFDSGFIATSVESRALSLARLIRKQGQGIDLGRSYLMISVGVAGLQFLVIRHGNLYFDYGSSWATVMDERGDITVERFTETLLGDFRQVSNFYSQHWGEPLAGIILDTAAFQDAATNALKSISSVPIVPLVLGGVSGLPSEWFPALGTSLRGGDGRDKDINLLGGGAQEIYREEKILNFLGFWRAVVPIAFALLLIAFTLADSFLMNTKASIDAEATLKISNSQLSRVNQLEASATAFNAAVANVISIESGIRPKYLAVDDLLGLASSTNVTITHMSLTGQNQMALAGQALDENSILALKDAIQKDPRFGAVNLPITNIQQTESGYSFSMTFPLSSQAFQP